MRIYDGRESFYQWDLNQKVTSNGLKVGDEVHFFSMHIPTALITIAYELDGLVVADVPNILLQRSYPITVYKMNVTEDGKSTVEQYQFPVKQRAKPDDYVYTETEVLNYKDLEERIAKLEEGGTGGGITEETDPTVPDWAKQPNPPSVDIPTALPNPHKLTITGAVSAEYDGSKAVSVEIPEGGGGGGSAEWEVINEVVTTEEVTSVRIATDTEGNPFNLLEGEVSISIPAAPSASAGWYFYFADGTKNFCVYMLPAKKVDVLIRYNTLSNHGSFMGAYSDGTDFSLPKPLIGHMFTEFRFLNWDSVKIPVGTTIRIIGRRA